MAQNSGRGVEFGTAQLAEGWTLNRLTRPSRLNGANGIRTGADGRIYVAQVAGSRVSAIDPDSGEISTISPIGGGITGPDDLVFDDRGDLYCTEITQNSVSVLRANGTSEILTGGINVANPITFHQGRLIVGELTIGARIMELDRGGGAPRVIADNVPMVNAFDVGPDGKLYFPAQAANEIWRVSLDGGEPEVVAKDLGVPDSVKFHPDGYIVSTQVYSGQVLKIDPRTGEKTVLADIGPGLDNVTFVNARTFVSHITGSIHEITAPGQFKPLVDKGLQWPLGLALGSNGTLFVSDGGFSYQIATDQKDGVGEPKLAGMLFSPGFPGWIRDVAASGANDAGGEWVVTTANGTVNRFWPERQESEEIASGYGLLMGIAVASDGAVVFADAASGKVWSAKGGNIDELASGLEHPMGLDIDANGSVYVAEAGAGRVVKIIGGRSETVIDGLDEPQGLAVGGGKLYVIDVKTKQLISCDLSGAARHAVASGLPVGAPPGIIAPRLGGVGDMCGPMHTMTGVEAGPDDTVYVSGDGEGSVLALRPA